MKWAEVSDYHLVSDKGYKVAKFKAGDDWKYRAFTSKKGDIDYQPIGSLFDCNKKAREAYEEHENANKR
ncbi:hypothetical protein MTZ49_11295 [Entomomonas sp. E2T0]|uniref:hypothetical protein n=1 Tax=Entomomonas sp. E2T0 TaxID=2930213 RepID=UPI0022280E46|nr:hypothetical protein [Entomomonas sp. E2T0]UYZ83182.1 hypothetical protein MTZ49_11295 [Entomomonas sp. E2T0]